MWLIFQQSYCLFIYNSLVWHKHDLIISFVGFGHPDQYLYVIPHEYLSGWENLAEKIILTKRKRCFPYHICSNFF